MDQSTNPRVTVRHHHRVQLRNRSWARVAPDVEAIPPAPLLPVFLALYKSEGFLSELDAARLIDKSVSRFRHLFPELTGKTYQSVRLKIKLSRAVKFLVESSLTIPQISALLRYSARDKFERAFKQ